MIDKNYKEKYKNHLIGDEPINIEIDESLFIYENNGQGEWFVKAIQTNSETIRFILFLIKLGQY